MEENKKLIDFMEHLSWYYGIDEVIDCTKHTEIVERYLDQQSNEVENIQGEPLSYWQENAEEEYLHTPISVLKYISILENLVDKNEERVESIATYFSKKTAMPTSWSNDILDFIINRSKN